MHYLDYAASSPPFPEALETYRAISTVYIGNPSSSHAHGVMAREKLTEARTEFLNLLGLHSAQLTLTASGTEANNLILRGFMEAHPRAHLLLAADAHASAWFAKSRYGRRVTILPLQKDGSIPPDTLRKRITRRIKLFSAVHVCNEIGTVHPVAEFAKICKKAGILFHCDGVQALGHIVPESCHFDADYYTFSAHKFGGPRGVGGVIHQNFDLHPQIFGGEQERRFRAGTENLAGICAAQHALELSLETIELQTKRLLMLQQLLCKKLESQLDACFLNTSGSSLPGLISISLPGLLASNLVADLSLAGFSISAGSACHSNQIEPSRIILAMGGTTEQALGTVRISMGRDTTRETIEAFIPVFTEAVQRQRLLD